VRIRPDGSVDGPWLELDGDASQRRVNSIVGIEKDRAGVAAERALEEAGRVAEGSPVAGLLERARRHSLSSAEKALAEVSRRQRLFDELTSAEAPRDSREKPREAERGRERPREAERSRA